MLSCGHVWVIIFSLMLLIFTLQILRLCNTTMIDRSMRIDEKLHIVIILTFSLSFARHQRATTTSQVRAIIIFKIHFHRRVPASARPHILHKVNLLITINHLSLFSRHCASGRGSRGLMLDHARRSTITLVRHT